MNAHQELAIKALKQMRGDDVYLARAAFRGLSEEEMQEQYEQSGRTRAQILSDYEKRSLDIDAAIAWVESAV